MCNLYSNLKSQEAVRQLFPRAKDNAGNMPYLPGVFPDNESLIVRNAADGQELVKARWGMPTPPKFLEGKRTDRGVTNIRNVKSPHWRRWLGLEHRCLVPFTSFAEPRRNPETGKSENVWFALGEDLPLAFFAGLWTTWTSVRKLKEGEVTADLFGFLTTEANAEVAKVHPKAMPVILTRPEEWETWLTAPDVTRLQRPLPDGTLQRVPAPEAA